MPMFQDAFDTIGLIKDLHPRNPQLEEKGGDDNAPSGYGDLTKGELKAIYVTPKSIEDFKKEHIAKFGQEKGMRNYYAYIEKLKDIALLDSKGSIAF